MMDESSLEEVTRLAPTIQDNLAIVGRSKKKR